MNPSPVSLCGLLAEPERLRTLAAVVLGATTPAAVAAHTGLPEREVAAALRRLQRAGVVGADEDGRLTTGAEVFKQAVREATSASTADEPLDPDPTRAGVLRSFIRDGRLVRLPSARGKRLIVLEHLAAAFEPGVKYPEREVDAVLRAWHPDYASLRRHLVDEQLMAREHGVYWRIGGPVY